jgi:uncharacterized protein DUF2799
MLRAAALFLLIALSGCALMPMSEADCRGVNWERRGYADGFGGHPPQDLRLARECGRLGIQISESEYLKGWRDGYDEWYRLIGSIDMN